MSEKKQYLIDEDTLKELLYASHKLEILERDGVDNWSWYMEGRTEYLAECASMLPWNEGRSIYEKQAAARQKALAMFATYADDIWW